MTFMLESGRERDLCVVQGAPDVNFISTIQQTNSDLCFAVSFALFPCAFFIFWKNVDVNFIA